MRVGVLASGAGTNLQAILDRLHAPTAEARAAGGDPPLPVVADPTGPAAPVEVVAVASDTSGAPALERAARLGIPTAVHPLADHPDRAARDAALAGFLDDHGAELVVLAGYMALLTPGFLARFPNRVVNVHPALLPAFPGLRAVEQALAHGVKVFGVTVHYVDEGVDTGPIIAQRAIELPDATSPDEVRAALRPLEHDLLCETVAALARRYRPAPMRGGE